MTEMTTETTKPDTKPDTKTDTKTVSGSDSTSDSSASADKTDSPASGSTSKKAGRGENQKVVTDSYRNNWNDIFKKKARKR